MHVCARVCALAHKIGCKFTKLILHTQVFFTFLAKKCKNICSIQKKAVLLHPLLTKRVPSYNG